MSCLKDRSTEHRGAARAAADAVVRRVRSRRPHSQNDQPQHGRTASCPVAAIADSHPVTQVASHRCRVIRAIVVRGAADADAHRGPPMTSVRGRRA